MVTGKVKSTKPSARALESRAKARLLGAKALAGGSSKQKGLAEFRRATFIESSSNKDDVLYAIKHYAAQNFKFWIEQREYVSELRAFDTLVSEYLDKVNSGSFKNSSDEIAMSNKVTRTRKAFGA